MQQALEAYSADGAGSGYLEVTFGEPQKSGRSEHPFLISNAEKRSSPRRRVLLSALVVNPEFNAIFRCRVRDVSASGAKLDIPAGYHTPPAFWLIALSSGIAYEAKLAWRKYPNVGIELGEPIVLDETVSRIGRRLRTIWLSMVS
jgi:PilZ domain